MPSPYRAVNTFHLGYKNQLIYSVRGTSRCLFSDKHKTHKYSVGRAYNCWMLNCWCITWPVGFKINIHRQQNDAFTGQNGVGIINSTFDRSGTRPFWTEAGTSAKCDLWKEKWEWKRLLFFHHLYTRGKIIFRKLIVFQKLNEFFPSLRDFTFAVFAQMRNRILSWATCVWSTLLRISFYDPGNIILQSVTVFPYWYLIFRLKCLLHLCPLYSCFKFKPFYSFLFDHPNIW